MKNPISPRTRGVLYLLGLVIGGLAVVVGPLIVALGINAEWAAVIVSLVGAVTSLLSLLARDNLPAPDDSDDTYYPQHAATVDTYVPTETDSEQLSRLSADQSRLRDA